jgi:hypothetical protein
MASAPGSNTVSVEPRYFGGPSLEILAMLSGQIGRSNSQSDGLVCGPSHCPCSCSECYCHCYCNQCGVSTDQLGTAGDQWSLQPERQVAHGDALEIFRFLSL